MEKQRRHKWDFGTKGTQLQIFPGRNIQGNMNRSMEKRLTNITSFTIWIQFYICWACTAVALWFCCTKKA